MIFPCTEKTLRCCLAWMTFVKSELNNRSINWICFQVYPCGLPAPLSNEAVHIGQQRRRCRLLIKFSSPHFLGPIFGGNLFRIPYGEPGHPLAFRRFRVKITSHTSSTKQLMCSKHPVFLTSYTNEQWLDKWIILGIN